MDIDVLEIAVRAAPNKDVPPFPPASRFDVPDPMTATTLHPKARPAFAVTDLRDVSGVNIQTVDPHLLAISKIQDLAVTCRRDVLKPEPRHPGTIPGRDNNVVVDSI